MSDTTEIEKQVKRRRTFAIISHPDAGKTTLTEKLLLFSGAIQIAGSVKARKAARHATSDWMEIEKQRGISVASSVMQMEYRDCVINLLDTPGHQDFSEDTYRVLTAVDAALMVIDAANGVEPQTRRLLQVCRARNTPILTFVNKMDREVQDPMSVMDEIEQELGMTVVPFTWPVGMGKLFHGVYDRREKRMRVFSPGEDKAGGDDEILAGLDNAEAAKRFGAEFTQAQDELELLNGASPEFDRAAFLSGKQTPMFFGSAINNFGVQEVLDALVDLAPAPAERAAIQRIVKPAEKKFSGVVFKIQANMDPAHRDRIAFLRVASGEFTRGMRLKVVRSGKELRPNTVVSFMSQRRELLDTAFAGDIIGIPNHGILQLGDTLTEGEALQFTGAEHLGRKKRHCFPTRDQRRIHARHAPQSGPQRQRNSAQHRGQLHEPTPRIARHGVCRRHHRYPQPWHSATRRHADGRRDAAVHRLAIFCTGNVPCRRSCRSAAQQAVACWTHAAGRRRRDSSLPTDFGLPAIAGRRRSVAV